MFARSARGIMCPVTLGSAFLQVFNNMTDISVSINFIILMQQLTPARFIPFMVLKWIVSNLIAKKIDVLDATKGSKLMLAVLVHKFNPVRYPMEYPISAFTPIPLKPSLTNLGK